MVVAVLMEQVASEFLERYAVLVSPMFRIGTETNSSR